MTTTEVRVQALDSGTGETVMFTFQANRAVDGEMLLAEYIRHLESDSGIDVEMLPVHRLLYSHVRPKADLATAVLECDDPHFGDMYITLIAYVGR